MNEYIDELLRRKLFESLAYGKSEIKKSEFVTWRPVYIYNVMGPSREVWYKPPPPTDDEKIQWFMETVFGDGGIRIFEDYFGGKLF